MHYIFLLILIAFSNLNSRETILVCKIDQELENNKTARKKVYKYESLNIFIDEKNKWINDFRFGDLKTKKDYFFDKKFVRKSNYFLFELKKFHNEEKKKIESISKILITKENMRLQFKKYYYDFNDKIFFTSEVIGNCK